LCGIIGYVGRREALERLLVGLRRLEYRGYDSAGIGLVRPGRIELVKTAGRLVDLERAVASVNPDATTGIGHTRWATHGEVNEANAHPFASCDGRVALVLNGIVENHLQLRRELEAAGHRCTSATDAEVVIHLIEDSLAAGQDLQAAVESATRSISGQVAFVCTSADAPDVLVGFRRGCPLVVGHGDGEMFLASMALGFSGDARSMTVLEEDELVAVTAEGVSVYRGRDRVARASLPVPVDDEVSKQGFPAFMLKELFEQADALERLLHAYVAPDSTQPQLETGLAELQVQQLDRILLLGCGTSYHAALAASFAFEAWGGIRTEPVVASEWRYGQRLLAPERTLVVAVSQSGETADTLGALQLAREAGAATIALSNIPGSQITRGADQVLLTHSGLELGVAATKTFSSQLALLLLLALQLAHQRRRLSDLYVATLVHELLALPDAVDRFFASNHRVDGLARRHSDTRFFFFLGRQSGFATCLEGALKVRELTYIPVEVHPAGEMKHGPIALLDEDAPVVCVATDRTVRDKLASNISEVRSRGAFVIAIAGDRDEEMQHLADDVIYVPETNPLLAPIVAVLPLQLLAYELATELGLDVDRPRNLAKTVTVE
jgi:glucosamine--fructose-6-phosphate aminotransferase (isomerizing)